MSERKPRCKCTAWKICAYCTDNPPDAPPPPSPEIGTAGELDKYAGHFFGLAGMPIIKPKSEQWKRYHKYGLEVRESIKAQTAELRELRGDRICAACEDMCKGLSSLAWEMVKQNIDTARSEGEKS